MFVDVQTFVLHCHQRGSSAVGNFPAFRIVSLFLGIGRNRKPFSRRIGRVAPPEMVDFADVKLPAGIQRFNRSALGVKKVCGAM